jgi:CSLREA domain-containing protein
MKLNGSLVKTRTISCRTTAFAAAAIAFLNGTASAQTQRELIEQRYCIGGDFLLVTTTRDEEDADGCTDEHCSLREAVNAGNVCPPGTGVDIALRDEDYPLERPGFEAPFDERTAGTRSALAVTAQIRVFANGATIHRERDEDTPEFRLFEVLRGGSLTIVDARLANGSARGNRTASDDASNGGAIYVEEGAVLTLDRVELSENRATGGGGAIVNAGFTFIVRSTMRRNKAGSSGAISNGFAGDLTIADSTITENTARQTIVGNSGRTTVLRSTISGNTADNASAIGNLQGTIELKSVTVHNNEATSVNGSGVEIFSGLATFKNTVISKNKPNNCNANTVTSSTIDLGSNVASDGSCTEWLRIPFEQFDDVMLEPLADNGGATQTHLPEPDSPLVDRGSCTERFDQRGNRRPQDGNADGSVICDVGAVERDQLFPNLLSPRFRNGPRVVPERFLSPLRDLMLFFDR